MAYKKSIKQQSPLKSIELRPFILIAIFIVLLLVWQLKTVKDLDQEQSFFKKIIKSSLRYLLPLRQNQVYRV